MPFEIIGVKNDMNMGLKSSNSNRLLYNVTLKLFQKKTGPYIVQDKTETDRPYTPVFRILYKFFSNEIIFMKFLNA